MSSWQLRHSPTHDDFGRVTAELSFSSSIDPSTDTIDSATAYTYVLYTYDDFNNTTTINRGGKTSTIYYDDYGREIKTETPSQAGVKETYTEYYPDGNVYWTGDNYENTVEYTYNNRDLATSVKVYYQENEMADAEEATTTYTYDVFGNPKTVTTPAGKTTSYTYDSIGRLLTETDPMTYTEQYVYDKAGNVVSMKDKNGVVTNNTYDNMYYLTNTTRGDLSTSYTYDTLGRMLTETNENGTTTYAYSGNNLASITYPDSKSISYEYDIMDNVKR